jgi:CDP-paratose 2-epimerase
MKNVRNLTAKRRETAPETYLVHAAAPRLQSPESMVEKTIGAVEWFRLGEYERVERVLNDIKALGVHDLRTAVSWADWCTREGQAWYGWLFPRLAEEVSLLPCFLYTPPSLGVVAKTSAPPREPKAYADFLDLMITRFGAFFERVELWNQPSNLFYWDWRLDPRWSIFSDMVGAAAHWARRRGKQTVLAGLCPTDPHWLEIMCERGIMQHIDVVGVHGFPGTWECDWDGWPANLAKVHAVLDRYAVKAQVWITETGFSTWRHDERGQLQAFVDAMVAPVARVFWYSVHDLHPDLPHQDGFHADERHYHFGLKRADGTPKLLFRLGSNAGIKSLQDTAWLGTSMPRRRDKRRPALITGGAGFVGTNLADRLLTAGRPVLIFDNLSRPGVDQNLRWLCERHGNGVQIDVADVRDRYALRQAARSVGQVYHFAAQVAVTTSLTDPVLDFEVNACGTLNLLEALRTLQSPPPLVFTSTNKVYGDLSDIALTKNCTRYEPEDLLIRRYGMNEDRPLDFHSPYGCSKGTADQYIMDYARTFPIQMVVFRMSCIYGPHQFGTEDQGWVAHFLIRAIEGQPIMLYGDGMQVRDILFIDDLLDAFLLAQAQMPKLSGQAFNIGGGPSQAISLLELIDLIAELRSERPEVNFADWRPGDQRYYVSDTRKFRVATGWAPQVGVRQGLKILHQWLVESHGQAAVCPAVGKVAS